MYSSVLVSGSGAGRASPLLSADRPGKRGEERQPFDDDRHVGLRPVTAELTRRERQVLAAVCATFQPTDGAADRALLLERVVGLIISLPDPDDRMRLKQLLSAIGSPIVNLALAGRFARFDRLDLDGRVAVMRGWADSRIQLRRAGFQALKRLVNVAYYSWPMADGSHPAWRAAGYPGPLPPLVPPSGGRLSTVGVTEDEILECDVVVCG